MLARRIFRLPHARFFLLLGLVAVLSSCASKPEPQLITEGARRESAIPWNQQEKWERQGQLGPMAERFQSR